MQCSPQDFFRNSWGGGGGRFSLCVHRSPLGKEVKQERNLRARKKKQKNEKERGEEKDEKIRKIKQREEKEKEKQQNGGNKK